ncbi:MAG: hypothetical protein ABI760_22520 [Ferruginibacter sp.]
MIPSAENSDYPKFVANQVLTSDNLNDLFGYLDEQGRMTRTNLIGIGIVCGLQVKTGTDGDGLNITITKGCGVTSAGYLVSVPELKFHHYNIFDAAKCTYYDKFVDTAGDADATPQIPPNTQRFPLWELKQLGEPEDAANLFHNLNDPVNFLNNLVVLLFVELLEKNNKNCDPDSCDDKGTNVTVSFRALLVTTANANSLITSISDNLTSSQFNLLSDIFMPRWDVSDTSPVNADHIISAYKIILTQNFIQTVQTALSDAYTAFYQVIADEYPADPFADFDLVGSFNFLYNGSISTNESVQIQYYYDFFSDLIQAYNEFCITGSEIISTCCPDESLFPRHLLLGEAIPLGLDLPSEYRHYFIYSVLYQRRDLLLTLKSLFRRLDLMVRSFLIPPVTSSGSATNDSFIRITPSKLSAIPISAKAIPYYYIPNLSPVPLYQYWSIEKSLRNRAQQILSYHSDRYNSTDDFVSHPLNFDLEPYNFLRIEGITGKQLNIVLDSIHNQINNLRLPFQVVAVSTGDPLTGTDNDDCCYLSDIELQYQVLRNQLLCCLKNNIAYWGSLEKRDEGKGTFIFQPSKVAGASIKQGLGSEIFGPTIMAGAGKTAESESFAIGKSFDNLSQTATNAGSQPMTTVVKGWFISESLTEIREMSMASEYLRYQQNANIPMVSLPAPQFNAPTENISYYILIILDELEEIADLLQEENIEAFNNEGFIAHANKLKDAYSKLNTLLKGYHSTEYLIDKIRLNTNTLHTADIDKIAMAMPVMSDGDAYIIILLLLNLPSTVEFIARLVRNSGKYNAQVATINGFYNTLDKDGMMIPFPIKEPEERGDYGYTSIQERLKNGMCFCDIDILKYLIEKYKQQKAKLSDVNNFSVYAKNHPGLQHKAGVTNGGTFVIVYKGSNDPGTGIAANTVIGDFYLPYACCNDCTPIQVVIQVPPQPENQPPIANAGTDKTITLPVTTSTLEGSATDPEGKPVTFAWTLTSGQTGVNITNANEDGSQVNVSGLVAVDTYTFQLVVTDDQGLPSAPDTVSITVSRANEGPVADAGPGKTITLPVTTSTLEGSGTDPEGNPVTFAWTLTSGQTGVNITNANEDGSQVNVSGLVAVDTYTFQLVVTDDQGLPSAPDTVSITVSRANEGPVADAGPGKTITLPVTTSTLEGSGTDPEGNPVTFAWTLTSGQAGVNITNANENGSHVNVSGLINVGIYTFQLVVTDEQGLPSAPDTVSITVIRANEGPVANAGPDKTITLPVTTSTLEGSATDPEGKPVTFAWTLTSGQTGVNITGANEDGSHVNVSGLVNVGIYTFQLVVTDEQGLPSPPDPVSVRVRPANQRPVVIAGPGKTIALPVNTTTLEVSGTDPEEMPLKFKWKQTSSQTGVNITDAIADGSQVNVSGLLIVGTYTFQVFAIDDQGLQSAPAAVSITVRGQKDEKSCAPLIDIINDFNKFIAAAKVGDLKNFLASYPDAKEVQAFYKELADKDIASLPVEKQVDFFRSRKIDSRLPGWIKDLEIIILQNFELRLLALAMLNIHTRLIYYIACIQKEDVDKSDKPDNPGKAQVPMEDALNALQDLLKNITFVFANSNLQQQLVWKNLLPITETESDLVKAKGEETSKPRYLEFLRIIIEILFDTFK